MSSTKGNASKSKSSPQAMNPKNFRSFVVQWQTLVIATSRSFWRELAQQSDWHVTMIAPSAFREGGMQDQLCAPNDPRNPHLVVLPVKRWHTQAVLFKGLTKTLRHWFTSYPGQKVFLCFTEPYAFTAMLAWSSLLISRLLTLGRSKKPIFLLYGFQNIYKKFPLPIQIIQNLMFKVSDGILVAGSEHESVLRRHGYKGPCIKLPMWYDREIFHPSTENNTQAKVKIGFAGSLLPEKGIQQILAFLADDVHGLEDCELNVAGGGKLQAEVKKQIADLNLKGLSAHFLGPIPVSEMANFYRSLDILMVPSRTAPHWKEQFGRVIIEAMACGCIVIGSDSGEIPVVIDNQEFIFPEDNMQKFKEVLLKVITKVKDRREIIRKEISTIASKKYSDIEVAKQFHHDLEIFVRNMERP